MVEVGGGGDAAGDIYLYSVAGNSFGGKERGVIEQQINE